MARTSGSDGRRTEEAIRAAAIDLIAEHGFAAVTLRDLAKEVGIQPGSVYRYFPSKNDLLLRLMVDHLQELLAQWQAASEGIADPLERLKTFIAFHVNYHASRQKEVFISNMEIRSLTKEHRRTVIALRESYEKSLRDLLEDGMRIGRFRTGDPQVSAYAILAMLTGLTAWFREGGRLSRAELVRLYEGLVLEGVLDNAEGLRQAH
ncbi:MAG: TetR/AcrR family transcriptional regulator [Rhodobiaceae bacterium]|nr:TetR family transcriptional regulator [Rhodobiaceae bacterium]MCC0056596.1 TetR/AcrR family transcriptional regulator [Rhodobiaceae bacterium]